MLTPLEPLSASEVRFRLQITGESFPECSNDKVCVRLRGPLGALPVYAIVQDVRGNELLVRGQARVPAEINQLEILFNVLPDPKHIQSKDFSISINTAPEQAAKALNTFQMKVETVKSAAYPNLFTILATKATGDGSFSSDPNKMRVELVPADASVVSIRPGANPNQLAIDVVGPEKLDVKQLIVTIYDSSDLATRKPVAIGLPFTEQVDPNQPVITKIETLYLQRTYGIGRIQIEGKGFGDYGPMPDSEAMACHQLKLWCVEYAGLCSDPASNNDPSAAEIAARLKVNLIPHNPVIRLTDTKIVYVDDKLIDVMFRFAIKPGFSDPFRLARVVVTIDKQGVKTTQTVTSSGLAADVGVAQTSEVLRAGEIVKVSTSREELQHVAGPRFQATVKTAERFTASLDNGPKRDDDLQYRYMVLDSRSVHRLFGKGIADNFYGIQLSVLNNGAKKVSIPLASIQAEIRWCQGDRSKGNQDPCVGSGHFLEGPPTLTPVQLGGVSGIFSAYEKRSDPRALVFNILKGVATFGGQLVPFVGPSFKDAQVFWTAGFTPAIGQIWIDMSSEQLQNLTTMTWQDQESVPASGGSINKFIFIPRSGQVLGPSNGPSAVAGEMFGHRNGRASKLISDILGIQVIGYAVVESEPKTATAAK